MVVTLLGIVIFSIPLSLKHSTPISSNLLPSRNVTRYSNLQLLKILLPSVFNVDGSVTFFTRVSLKTLLYR